MDCQTKQELMDKLADILSRLRDRLLVEKDAVRNLDAKRMNELESEIGQILDEKIEVLASLRRHVKDHGC
jgi:hypothetical protein